MIKYEQEYNQDFINTFLETINFSQEDINRGASLDSTQTHHIFQIHNRFVNPKTPEYSKSCAPCRGRIYKRVIEWYSGQPWKTFEPKLLQ